jgi:regulator of protease activity HflC (stomatin/prohibitin superfamily)
VIAAQAEGESKRLVAEGEAAGIRVRGEAEATKIAAIGKSTAEAYAQQNKAIGGDGVTAIEIAKQIATGNVKITPEFLVQGGDSQGGLISAFFAQLIAKGQREGSDKAAGR